MADKAEWARRFHVMYNNLTFNDSFHIVNLTFVTHYEQEHAIPD